MSGQPRVEGSTDLWAGRGRTRSSVALDLVLAAGYCTVAILVGHVLGSWAVVAGPLLAIAWVIRRWSLPVMVGLAVAAAVIQVVTGQVNIAADLAYGPLFFVLGAHLQERVRRFGLVAAGVATLVAGLWAAFNQSGVLGDSGPRLYSGLAMAAMTAVVVFGGWVVGYLRWQRRGRLQDRADAAVQAVERRRLQDLYEQEQQRSRIAADMHDVVAHSWAVVAAQADGARYVLREHPERAEQALTVIGETARSAMGDVRSLLGQLRDQSAGSGDLIVERADDVLARMRASGMDLRRTTHGIPAEAGLAAVTAHRVLAEALTNALKHGDLSWPVTVSDDWRHGYRLEVRNALGPGQPVGAGHGLTGMAERLAVAGGTLTAGPEDGEWVVRAEIKGAS